MTVNITLSLEEMIRAVESGAMQVLNQAIKKADKEDLARLKETVDKAEPAEEAIEEPIGRGEQKVTKEDVRKVLAEKKKEGKREEVKNLIESYGVSTFPAIPEENYPELYQKARAL